MNIYVASAIDKNTDGGKSLAETAAEEVAEHLSALDDNVCLYFPARPYHVLSKDDNVSADLAEYIVSVNAFALQAADAMLLIYKEGIESWGTPMELAAATHANIPVVVLCVGDGVAPASMPIYFTFCVGDSVVTRNPHAAATAIKTIAEATWDKLWEIAQSS